MRVFTGFQKGIDLGGWFSQCDHTEARYDTFITAADFAVIRSWGCDHVRLPIDYELLEDKYGAPREQGYERLEQAIGWARENGLNVVLDLHKTAGFSFDPGEQEAGFFENGKYQERFYALWERIARRFGQYAGMLAFELLNEVTEREYGPVWNRIAAACVRRIRAYAPETKILIGGYCHNSAAAVKDLPAPFDENIVYNFHCYEPLIFTHQGAYWMPPMETSFRIPSRPPMGRWPKPAAATSTAPRQAWRPSRRTAIWTAPISKRSSPRPSAPPNPGTCPFIAGSTASSTRPPRRTPFAGTA